MYGLFTKLKAIELILNTSSYYTGATISYWLKERKDTLKKILELQISEFRRD